MRFGKASGQIAVLGVAVAMIVLRGGPAGATVTGHSVFHGTTSYEFTDIGCHEQDVVHLVGDITVHETDVNGGLRIAVLTTGTVTFTESGESFAGRFTNPFTHIVQASGSEVISAAFTMVLFGDDGHVAELHATAQVVYDARSDTFPTQFQIVHQSCA